jgi:hypothetical protein
MLETSIAKCFPETLTASLQTICLPLGLFPELIGAEFALARGQLQGFSLLILHSTELR